LGISIFSTSSHAHQRTRPEGIRGKRCFRLRALGSLRITGAAPRRWSVVAAHDRADIIRGKDFSHSRCLLTGFHAGDGHDKAPKSVERRQRTMRSGP
jgi:hypothetical protein